MLICLVLSVTSCMIPSTSPSPQTPSSPPAPEQSPSSPSPLTPSTPSPAPILEVAQSTGQVPRRYVWDYGSKEWTLELTIPESLYDYYSEIPRPPTRNYSVYVTHPLDDIYVRHLVEEIEKAAHDEGFDALETVEFATAFVQSLPYTADSVTTPYDEYPRYPVETLVDNGGDCEDTSILLASLLDTMGYSVILILYPGSHAAVGVLGGEGLHGTYFQYDGGNYFYVETTDTGWRLGDIPAELQGVTAHIYDMTPTPILTHHWSATVRGAAVEVEVTVENLGTLGADGVYILAGFDGGGDMLWNSEESEIFALPVDQRITVPFKLQPPLGKHTRLVIQVIQGGYAVDESYSEWFDT